MRILVFLLGSTALFAQTVALNNTSNSVLSPDFVVGDSFTVNISGAAANATVSVVSYQNGVSNTGGVPFSVGTTNSSGDWSTFGSMSASNTGNWQETWYVNGTQLGSEIDFVIADKPTALTVISDPTVAPAGALAVCGSSYYGILIDNKYQITGANGNVSTLGLLMTPYESGTFPDGTAYSQNIGPASGYSNSSQYAASDGTFHDVPVGECRTSQNFIGDHVSQTISINVGSKQYQVRSQTFTINGVTLNHGSISNASDIVVSR